MKTKHTIKLGDSSIEIEWKRILANDVVLPWETHPHGMRPWVIGNEYGALAVVWASCEQDAMDEGMDAGLLDSFLVDELEVVKMSDEEREELTPLGNAGELCNLTYAWIKELPLKDQPIELLCAFAEARGSNADTLEDF